MAQSPPSTLGKYQIIREIARSNDIVYEAWDPVMSRRVAVKELAIPGGATVAQKEDRLKRFTREAKAAGSLVHPSIVTVFEVGREGDRHFIAMEFLDGRTLRAEMDVSGALGPERSVDVAVATLRGLEFAHSNGVIHRDVKPENIQILESGAIKLTDFGIARLTFEPNLTMDGQVFGTPSYMSPEQIHGKDIDARSDVFSVGIILYEMVAGKKPFSGDSVVSITYSIMNNDPSQPQNCPYGLWKVIKTALEKAPSMRYQDAGKMADALRGCLSVSAPVLTDPGYGVPGQPWTAGGATQGPYGGIRGYAQSTQPASFGGGQIVVPTGTVNPFAPPHQTVAPGGVALTPYGTPMPQSFGVPVTQPYSAHPSTTYVPYQPTLAPPTVPVYYPPPPRRPLFKAETLDFLGKALMAVVLLGLVSAILIYGVNALGKGADTVRPAIPADQPLASPSVAAPGPTQSDLVTRDPVNGAIVKDKEQPTGVAAEELLLEGQGMAELAAREDFPAKRGELMAAAHTKFAAAISSDPERRGDRLALVFTYFLTKVNEYQLAGDKDRVRFFVQHGRAYAGDDPTNVQTIGAWDEWVRANP